MDKISLSALKKQLKTYKEDELIAIITDCYKLSEDVKKYIHVSLDPEGTREQLFNEAKAKIAHEFYPERGEPKLKLAQAKKAISEFNKLCNEPVKELDLMIYYVELGVRFTNDYGDIEDRFYYSMESMYLKVINEIIKVNEIALYHQFKDRLLAIVTDSDGIGWGFHDQLAAIYSEIEVEFEYNKED